MALEERTGIFGKYWGNTYDSSVALNMEQMKINATYIWLSLREKGWSMNAVAGMLGNMQSESSINPGRWESNIVGGDPTAHGYGLVQWTPYTKYTDWIVNQGYNDPSEMDANLFRINYEVDNEIQWIPTTQYPFTFNQFKISQLSPYELAMMFIVNYERPADPDQPARGTQAEFWFEFLGGVVPPTPTVKKKNNFPWVIMTNKLRQKRTIF